MTTSFITFRRAGPYSTVQDMGRTGHQSVGVPESGALNRFALKLGNRLVGNPDHAAGIEICMGGVTVSMNTTRRVALTGTVDSTLLITDAYGHQMEIKANRSVTVRAGLSIMINALSDTNTAYLAVSGGIGIPLLYQSRSTSPNAMIGGWQGRCIADGDQLPLLDDQSADTSENMSEWMIENPDMFAPKDMFRVVLGPQDNRFTEQAITTFLSSEYTVSPLLNRMGMRLDGDLLTHIDNADIASDGIVTGSIQVPGDGMPIILLADHQTTGGYTKIATVIQPDIPALSSRKPGQAVRFTAVSVDEAETLSRQAEDQFQAMLKQMVAPPPVIDIASLYQLGDTTGD
ncbi:biotin-dependent carboxyltransferase family protein [Alphaproteobacteria bacterium]|nr:biotin-dependent carboxyltransferase family protein [Alphaproteobacteria bacterium]